MGTITSKPKPPKPPTIRLSDLEAFKVATPKVKNNPKACLRMVSVFGSALEYCSVDIKNNKTIVLQACQQFGQALQYASDAMKDDDDIALHAVLNSQGGALSMCSKRLQRDPDLVRTSISLNGRSIQSAHESFRKDPVSCRIAVESCPWAIEYIGALHASHPKTLLRLACRAAQCEWRVLQNVMPPELQHKTNGDMACAIAKRALCGWKPSGALTSDMKFAFLIGMVRRGRPQQPTRRPFKTFLPVYLIRTILAWAEDRIEVTNSLKALDYLHPSYSVKRGESSRTPDCKSVIENLQVMRLACRTYPEALSKFQGFWFTESSIITEESKQIALSAVTRNGLLLKHLQDCHLKDDSDIICAALTSNHNALQYVAGIENIFCSKSATTTPKNKIRDVVKQILIEHPSALVHLFHTLVHLKRGDYNQEVAQQHAQVERQHINRHRRYPHQALQAGAVDRANAQLASHYFDLLQIQVEQQYLTPQIPFNPNIRVKLTIPSEIILSIIRGNSLVILKDARGVGIDNRRPIGGRVDRSVSVKRVEDHEEEGAGEQVLRAFRYLASMHVNEELERKIRIPTIDVKSQEEWMRELVYSVCGMDLDKLMVECVLHGGGGALVWGLMTNALPSEVQLQALEEWKKKIMLNGGAVATAAAGRFSNKETKEGGDDTKEVVTEESKEASSQLEVAIANANLCLDNGLVTQVEDDVMVATAKAAFADPATRRILDRSAMSLWINGLLAEDGCKVDSALRAATDNGLLEMIADGQALLEARSKLLELEPGVERFPLYLPFNRFKRYEELFVDNPVVENPVMENPVVLRDEV